MAKVKTIIGAIEDQIDKVINQLNDKEYDGYSNYYYHLNADMPHIISGLHFSINLLLEAEALTKPQAEYFIEKIKTIKW